MKAMLKSMEGKQVLVLVPENPDEEAFVKKVHQEFKNSTFPIIAKLATSGTSIETLGGVS